MPTLFLPLPRTHRRAAFQKRNSEQYRLTVAHEYIKSVNNKTIAREFGISPNTVERIIHEQFHLKIREALSYPAPLMIGIDEHTIHRGAG